MAEGRQVEVRIAGEGISPSSLRSSELANVLQAVEDMITSYVVRENPELETESIVIALTSIESGSVGLQFSSNTIAHIIPAMEAIAAAINDNNFRSLPSGTIKGLRSIGRFTRRHKCETEFYILNGSRDLRAVVTPETRFRVDSPLRGHTVIYGQITRVGGAREPRVQFRTIDGVLLYCDTSKAIAQKAGSHLYSKVGLQGIASWHPHTLEIEAFTIEDILPYEETLATDAFAKLREVAGDSFDKIDDVDAYVRRIRYGV